MTTFKISYFNVMNALRSYDQRAQSRFEAERLFYEKHPGSKVENIEIVNKKIPGKYK